MRKLLTYWMTTIIKEFLNYMEKNQTTYSDMMN